MNFVMSFYCYLRVGLCDAVPHVCPASEYCILVLCNGFGVARLQTSFLFSAEVSGSVSGSGSGSAILETVVCLL